MLRDCGGLDSGDLVIELERLLSERADVRRALSERFPFLIVDELEDAGAAHRALVEALVAEHGNLVCACDLGQSIRRPPQAVRDPAPSFMDHHPDADQVNLDRPLRFGPTIAKAAVAVSVQAQGAPVRASDEVAGPAAEPAAPPAPRPAGNGAEGEASGGVVQEASGGVIQEASVRFWRCSGERAQAEAAAREIEHLLAAGEVRPEAVCVIVGSGWREARLVAAALEERRVPFRFAGDAALFQRPEVRDVLAWLRCSRIRLTRPRWCGP